MPAWLDRIKGKAKETLSDQEKIDRIKAKAEETLGNREKMAGLAQKAEGAIGGLTGHKSAPSAAAGASSEAASVAPEMRVDAVPRAATEDAVSDEEKR